MNRKRRKWGGAVRESRRGKRRRFVPAGEPTEALPEDPAYDYEQLRAEIDAVVDQDPTPRYWVK